MILLDTNVLVYAVDADAPQHEPSFTVVQRALDGTIPGVVVPQVLLEFFAVVTHSRRVQHPLSPVQAWEQITLLRTGLRVLDLQPAALTVLGELVLGGRPAGPAIFDLFLIAQMRTHGVATICTHNVPDFAGVPGIEALAPPDLLARHDHSV